MNPEFSLAAKCHGQDRVRFNANELEQTSKLKREDEFRREFKN
jgi:hypothetical protein